MRLTPVYLVWMLVVAVALPAPASDLERERVTLLRTHAIEREAHLMGDSALLTAGMADKLMEVQDGKVTWRTRDESREFFAQYFSRVKYRTWEDAIPPEVRVSPDGKMGWMAVQVKARFTEADDSKEQEFTSSWIAVYEKQGDEWKLVAIASGFERPKE